MLVVVHHRVGVHANVKQLDGAIATGHKDLVLVDLGPCQVVQCVVRVKATVAVRQYPKTKKTKKKEKKQQQQQGKTAYVFSTWMPAAVRPSEYSLPLPTIPKLAAVATATRLS